MQVANSCIRHRFWRRNQLTPFQATTFNVFLTSKISSLPKRLRLRRLDSCGLTQWLGQLGWSTLLKPTKVTLFTMILCNLESNISKPIWNKSFIMFGTSHCSRCKAIVLSIVLSQQCCEVYFTSYSNEAVMTLTTKCYRVHLPKRY